MKKLQYFDQIQDIMTRSGKLVMGYFRSDFKIWKKGLHSCVTQVDIENEQFLMAELAKVVPSAQFYTEELGVVGKPSDYQWVIDALDGTKNFIKGLPHFCIMVALTYRDKPIVSAIYLPMTQELYYAELGKGLWRNGIEMHPADSLQSSKIALMNGSDTSVRAIKLKLKQEDIQISKRYFGSLGIDAVYLITQSIDLMLCSDVAWYDIAAPILLIEQVPWMVCKYERSSAKEGLWTLRAGNKIFFP